MSEVGVAARADCVIVGGGIAGLMTALALSAQTHGRQCRIIVLARDVLGVGAATAWAQGGIAAALGEGDSPDLHAADTLAAAGGIADAHAVAVLTSEASERIADLVRFGAKFDRNADGAFALGREGAHGRRRILHAGGDATGRALLDVLVRAVSERPAIEVVEHAVALELLRDDERVFGVIADVEGSIHAYTAPAVVLATGGMGGLYSHTTNPLQACGEGLIMAARAGAVSADVEFVQFHPTALDIGLDPMPLLTEALRGEGAMIVDDCGDRFTAELAPRDVVARAMYEHRRAGRRVFLDVRAIESFSVRFPGADALCRTVGIDPYHALIPIAPAAHYHMGGVAVNAWGRSSVAGLWACGEVAATGVHGANRLASNSLLEGLVFAGRVAQDIAGLTPSTMPLKAVKCVEIWDAEAARPSASCASDIEAIVRLRRVMDEHVGVVRDHDSLAAGIDAIEQVASAALSPAVRNRVVLSRAIARAACARLETRGSHARRDYPLSRAEYAHRSFVSSDMLLQPFACAVAS